MGKADIPSNHVGSDDALARKKLQRAAEDGARLYWIRMHDPNGTTLADDHRINGILSLDLLDALAAYDRLGYRVRELEVALDEATNPPKRITHGRHCSCSACAREDWTRPHLAYCGMHGESCPPVYAPLGGAGEREPLDPGSAV